MSHGLQNPLGRPALASAEVVSGALKYLAGIEHTFIAPALVAVMSECETLSAIVIRELSPKVISLSSFVLIGVGKFEGSHFSQQELSNAVQSQIRL